MPVAKRKLAPNEPSAKVVELFNTTGSPFLDGVARVVEKHLGPDLARDFRSVCIVRARGRLPELNDRTDRVVARGIVFADERVAEALAPDQTQWRYEPSKGVYPRF